MEFGRRLPDKKRSSRRSRNAAKGSAQPLRWAVCQPPDRQEKAGRLQGRSDPCCLCGPDRKLLSKGQGDVCDASYGDALRGPQGSRPPCDNEKEFWLLAFYSRARPRRSWQLLPPLCRAGDIQRLHRPWNRAGVLSCVLLLQKMPELRQRKELSS